VLDQYVKILDRNDFPFGQCGEGIQDYLWYFHEVEEMNPYFRGLGVVLYRLVYIRSKVIQYWADLCESWAKPFMTLSINMAKGALSSIAMGDIKSAEDRVTAWLETLEAARSRHAIVKDMNDKIEILEHGTTGNNIIRELLSYVDERIQNIFLGGSLSTGTGKGVGSYALGEVHAEQTEYLVQYSRSRLEDVLARGILDDLVWKNRENFRQLGISVPKPGEVQLKIQARKEESDGKRSRS
jgi:hypothetical protein